MEAVCARGDAGCEAHALSAALHALHLYCATISAALICCCAPGHHSWYGKRWRGQNVRGAATLTVGAAWCCGAAAGSLRPAATVALVSLTLAPLAWLAATALHVALWTRRSAAPLLYLAIYWLLAAASSAGILYQNLATTASPNHIELYIQGISLVLSLVTAGVDSVCFYDEVTKRHRDRPKSSIESHNVSYKHNNTHFFSKITFFWLNYLLWSGYESPLEEDDLGELPEDERSTIYYHKFKTIYNLDRKVTKPDERNPSIWRCYMRTVWPNFYIAGLMKLLSDLISVVPPLGLAVIIQYIEGPLETYDGSSEVTLQEFFSNGYVMLLVVTLALVFQALLSQNSTHLVTVEGTRLKTGLQGMLFDKCMRLAPWSSNDNNGDEESPLLHAPEDSSATPSGVLTNLMSQDTYNIMSCVWICHYLWAIPLKVAVILYLLYTKLGVSAIIGTAVSVLFITPLQFYIGKKISDNSKDISKCTDHRISKITEILQGMNVIKLYVWEDLFKEKILNLREVELKLLNKDSIYWSFLTFTTQVSTVLVTVITFLAYYFLNDSKGLTAVNVFAGLTLFNQLTVPLLILPVTVLMMIQAMVSTNRIKDFLELPESNNVREDCLSENSRKPSDIFNDAFVDNVPDDNSMVEDGVKDIVDAEDQFSDDENCGISSNQEYVVRFRNAAFSWGMKNDMLLEVDDLDIPAGKLIMVVGTSGAGKSSLLSAMLGEMFLERGDVTYNGRCTTWYAGQPPWLVEGSVRDNIVMGSPWCQRRYGRVLRAAALRPDLQLLPEGDATRLGSHGAPLSGGQRVRVCIARALYSGARLLALDEPLAALDAPLARHVVARALVPVARAGRTVVVATNRLELLHYADLVIAMEEGRVSGVGRAGAGVCPGGAGAAGAVSRWARLAAEARAAAARAGAGPPGGAARERTRLMRELTRARFQRCNSDDTMVGICEAAGAHLLAEVPTRAGGSWRRAARQRPALERQLSSPPPSVHNYKWRREVRRAVSADASNAALQREASLLRRLLRPRPHRTLARWTPRTLRRLLSSDSETTTEENIPNGVVDESALETAYTSLTSNGTETSTVVIQEETPNKPESDEPATEGGATCEYARACGWWGRAYWAAAAAAQALALLADYWLTRATAKNAQAPLTDEEMWWSVRSYAGWCLCVVVCGGLAQCAGGAAGARARRALHERLLHAALHAPLHHHRSAAPAALLHRFSADVQVIDRKLPIAVSRWGQLALLCVAALLVNAIASPWSLLALLPAVALYFTLQSVYLSNARELQRTEALSAASVVALAAETSAGGGAVRAGRLQPHMRAALLARLDVNNNALLLLNAANRWLGLTLDLVGAATVCVSIGVALHGGGGGAVAGLAGAYSLLLPAYLAHLAKCRADLDLQLAAVERVRADTNVPQEDYREDCAIPSGWQRNGKMDFENVNIQHDPDSQPILNNINISIAPGEKVAVCGRSGSGKSTLVLTCAGATTIRSGRLLIDGADATQVPLRALRHRVVVLPQEAMMFSGTLRENLDPLGVHTDEEIWQSLRAVGLQDFVTAQPAGLECGVGRGGCSWSGGRAARACAARAALHARLAGALVLDEPAAALDAPAERALLAALAAAAPNTTIITVAHRISSVRGYDRAVVLDEGRVVEQGAVGALLAQPASRLARMLAAHRSP
ncbi:ATP-binding cassette sub-family C member Sur-like [Ostrinia nubilalis]|uniref:ATP-binding cassette sub-family C member Sur-like n=1 Tax=Ostrinia nubilalis TaxID=29057 RepID=UPI0030822A69